jgi:cellulose synthase/poly-beta-1,6-N-acetylglucosamine synthase-like glycosyltransferase
MSALLTLLAVLGWSAVALLALVIASNLYLAVLRLLVLREPPPAPDNGERPDVLVQIPLYNEKNVVEGALIAACAFDWPRNKLHIQLLDDSTDDTPDLAAPLIARFCAEGFDVQHIRRDNREGFKAGALAEGLRLSNAPYAAVLDADFRAPPDWLKTVVLALHQAPHAAFCQSRNAFVSTSPNWLTRAQQLLQDAHYAVEQPARAWRGLPFQFNGTGGVWRVSAISDAGGWSHETLTEDLDLVLRCFLHGWGGLYVMGPSPLGQVPHESEAFAAQQQRWSKGIVQVGKKLWRDILASSWSLEAKTITLMMFVGHFMFPAVAMAFGALVLSSLLMGALNTPLALALLALVGAALATAIAMTLPAFLMLKRGSLTLYWKTFVSLPAMAIFLTVSNAAIVVKAAGGEGGEFVRTPKGKVD